MSDIGKALILFGLILLLLGVFLVFFNRIPFIGKLPGDILIRKENSTFYFPLATSLLLSAIVSLLLWVFRKQ